MSSTSRTTIRARHQAAVQICTSILVLAAGITLASSRPAAAWNGEATVKMIVVDRDSGTLLALFNGAPGHDCTPYPFWQERYRIGSANSPSPLEKFLFTTLLAAQLSGKRVWILTDEARPNGCVGGVEQIRHVNIIENY